MGHKSFSKLVAVTMASLVVLAGCGREVRPHPTAQPSPSITVEANEADEDSNKPRRTGWWARRILGG